MANKEYKYRIQHYLNHKVSKSEYDKAMKELPEQLEVHKNTFQRWRYAKIDDNLEIKGTHIIKMAKYFGVEPVDMFTLHDEIV